MTEREYRLVLENYELREKLVRTQKRLRVARARLRNWPLRQQAWRREQRRLDGTIDALQNELAFAEKAARRH